MQLVWQLIGEVARWVLGLSDSCANTVLQCCPKNPKTRTPGPTPSSCGVQCTEVLQLCTVQWCAVGGGKQGRRECRGFVSTMFLESINIFSSAAESCPGSPDSEASWQIIREPSLTAPGMPQKMSCGMETDFFMNEWMEWNGMEWNEMKEWLT